MCSCCLNSLILNYWTLGLLDPLYQTDFFRTTNVAVTLACVGGRKKRHVILTDPITQEEEHVQATSAARWDKTELLLLFIFFGGIFYFFVLYSTLLHLPPLRFRCADGCWDRTVRKFYGWIQNDRWATQIEDCELTVPRRVSKTIARSLLFSWRCSKELSSTRFRLEKWDRNLKMSVSWTDI